MAFVSNLNTILLSTGKIPKIIDLLNIKTGINVIINNINNIFVDFFIFLFFSF